MWMLMVAWWRIHRKAISGYTFIINGGAVSWIAKKQEIISLSTTESEYIAATYAAKEALWLHPLISQLFSITLPATTLFLDNKSAIVLTKEHQYYARTKHIDVRYHFIHWIVKEEKICLIYCPTNEMVADTLTKALPSAKMKHFTTALGLITVWGVLGNPNTCMSLDGPFFQVAQVLSLRALLSGMHLMVFMPSHASFFFSTSCNAYWYPLLPAIIPVYSLWHLVVYIL